MIRADSYPQRWQPMFDLDKLLFRVTQKRILRKILTPVLRVYIRYFPFSRGKRSFWTRVIEPYFAWRSHNFVARTMFGARMAGDTCDMIQQYIYYFGIWEPNLTHWIIGRLRRGDTFVDVGANVGYYALLASTLVGSSGKVVAIEASPHIFSLLCANLSRQRVRNVRAVNIAAADSVGTIRVFKGPTYNLGKATVVEAEGSGFEAEVNTAPLNRILESDELREARIIKIDVEGSEASVISGFAGSLETCHPDLEVVLEINKKHLARVGRSSEEVFHTFYDAGFNAYRLPDDYWALTCIRPYDLHRPVRCGAELEGDAVIIFSKCDVEFL
jgi:FkbM family methyltransferase